MKLPFYGVGVDLPHLVSQIWSVRIGIKICEIAVLQGVDLPPLVSQIWAVRIGIKICEIAILWGGGRPATPGLPNMSCQNRNQNCEITILPPGVGLDLPHLVSQTWSVRIGIKICEITILWGGGRSATPGESNMKCQNRNQNLWNCCSTGGRSATPGQPNMSCQNRNQNLWNCHFMLWGRFATPSLPNMSCQNRN